MHACFLSWPVVTWSYEGCRQRGTPMANLRVGRTAVRCHKLAPYASSPWPLLGPKTLCMFWASWLIELVITPRLLHIINYERCSQFLFKLRPSSCSTVVQPRAMTLHSRCGSERLKGGRGGRKGSTCTVSNIHTPSIFLSVRALIYLLLSFPPVLGRMLSHCAQSMADKCTIIKLYVMCLKQGVTWLHCKTTIKTQHSLFLSSTAQAYGQGLAGPGGITFQPEGEGVLWHRICRWNVSYGIKDIIPDWVTMPLNCQITFYLNLH